MNSLADGQEETGDRDGVVTGEPDDAPGDGASAAWPGGSASERQAAVPTTQASTARQSNGRNTAPLCMSRTFPAYRVDGTPSMIVRVSHGCDSNVSMYYGFGTASPRPE